MTVSPTSGVGRVNGYVPATSTERKAEGFGEAITRAIAEVNKLQVAADDAAVRLATGEVRDLHEVMIITEQANVALQLTLQIRNKVLDAYQEIMRMQV